MHLLGKINNRQILYLDIGNDLDEFSAAQLTNWVVFVICDDITNPLLTPFASNCIDKDVLYMYAAGKVCSEIDDLFDWEMVMRKLEGGKLPGWHKTDEDVLMTSWHHNFDEGFWFVATVTEYDDYLIDTVLVANFTGENYLPKIEQLTRQINEGWLPPD